MAAIAAIFAMPNLAIVWVVIVIGCSIAAIVLVFRQSTVERNISMSWSMIIVLGVTVLAAFLVYVFFVSSQ